MFPAVTPHLNPFSLEIRSHPETGRGIYVTRAIPAQTVIEISPCLLFPKDEYETHGQHTLLDHYTFVWKNGQMALALGLGSLFNHSSTPNVSYSLQFDTMSIKFTVTRTVQPDEELCIFYTHGPLWFDSKGKRTNEQQPVLPEDELRTMMTIGMEDIGSTLDNVRPSRVIKDTPKDTTMFIPREQLPFIRIQTENVEEEDVDNIQTIDVRVVDIPDPQRIQTITSYIRVNSLDTDDLKHLKRIRKTVQDGTPGFRLSIVLAPVSTPLPDLPPDFGSPVVVAVPKFSASTAEHLRVKSALWPTLFTPNQKPKEPEWSQEQVSVIRQTFAAVVSEARKGSSQGELPIGACLLSSSSQLSHLAHDTRVTTCHPLRHAVLNLIRKVSSSPAFSDEKSARNGEGYLLTHQTIFLTHEPCVMCTMAMLHSRVKEVFYIHGMGETGGCGGCVTVTALKSVNHRFKIWKWKNEGDWDGIKIEKEIDA